MRIMTTNIWGEYFNNPVALREDNIYKVYEKYAPDIIGIQEADQKWYESTLFKRLSDKYYFVGTNLFENNNFVPLAVSKEFKHIADGFEYLEETPCETKAITWAVLEDRNNSVFAVCNTHFWWMPGEEHERIRLKNADQLSRLMEYIKVRFNCPVFAFGDMNCRCTSKVFTVVYPLNNVARLFDTAECKNNVGSLHGDPILGEDGKYHGSKSGIDDTYSIDHIIGTKDGYKVLNYITVEDDYVLDATDHSPVYADIELL